VRATRRDSVVPRGTLLAIILPALFWNAAAAQVPAFERAFPLRPEEGVFAYSRISPDGRYLAYASMARDPRKTPGVPMTINIVDLHNQRVLFSERGLDGYWSPDGKRLIFSSNTTGTVSIRHMGDGSITRNVAPMGLGDYYSWGTRDGKDLILTILSNYYYLDGDHEAKPMVRVPPCPVIGVGERPLISHDGKRVTTFVGGTVVVRSLSDCSYIFDTGLQGAKADFSWDGRYIAFHVPRAETDSSYDIVVVDLRDSTVRNVTASLPGSSFYPNWTRDGRLSFRYDGDEYRGFMFASNVLSVPAKPLSGMQHLPMRRTWGQIFPETPQPSDEYAIVLIWATWNAHSPLALWDLQAARADWRKAGVDIAVTTAADPASHPADVQRLIDDNRIVLPRIPLTPAGEKFTEADNQMPTTLLFHRGVLVDRKLGAQSTRELEAWVKSIQANGGRAATGPGM